MDKSSLRAYHQQIRNQTDVETLNRATHRIFTSACAYLVPNLSMGIYISKDREVDTRALIMEALKRGCKVCVPKVIDHKLVFIQIHSLNECTLGSFGILEPISSVPYGEKIDLQFVPMLAFNSKGFRLGYGKGYYDAYLKDFKGISIGLCYQFNQDERLTEEMHDISCQIILTDISKITPML